MEKYYPPQFGNSSFHCPNCGVYSQQHWRDVWVKNNGSVSISDLKLAFCTHCDDKSIWSKEIMIEPNIGGVPFPNQDIPKDLIADYCEARDILNKSPRGSSALLRLVVEKMCIELGCKGKNINDNIGELVKKGLSPKIQQALDYVRVIGNNSVHPGKIELTDNKEIAIKLFELVNLIAEVTITQQKEVDQLYNSLPKKQIETIENRDKE